MKPFRAYRLGVVLALSLSAALTTLPATLPPQSSGSGQIEVGSEEGLKNFPEVTPGEDIITEEEFNPTITCTVGPGDTIYDIIDCLLDEISNPPPPCEPDGITSVVGPGGDPGDLGEPVHLQLVLDQDGDDGCAVYPHDRSDFDVYPLPWPHFGVEVVRLDGDPMERIMFRENDPGIQTTQLRIDNSFRVGRIGEVTEIPSGEGEILLTVNDVTIAVPTRVSLTVDPIGSSLTSVEVNASIIAKLRRTRFAVVYESPYIYIGSTADRGIHRLQFRSTDPAITASDLGLLAPGDPELASITTDEPAFLAPAAPGAGIPDPGTREPVEGGGSQ